MKNLYEVLVINKNSSEKEIKDRYMTLVRKYPPEKEPQKFAEIREAYEILSNPKQKREHDRALEIELEKKRKILKKLEEEADLALKNGDFEKAIKNYKKLLIEETNLKKIKSKLGIAFLKNNNLKEAEKIFKELVETDDSFENNYNLSKVYILLKNYNKAEEYLFRAKEKNEKEEVYLELLDVESYLKNDEQVEKLIHDFLNKYNSNLKIVNYSLNLIVKYIKEENESKIYRLLKKNINKLDSIKLEEGLINEFINLVYKLYYLNMMDSAEVLSERLTSLGCTELDGIIYEKIDRDYDIKEEVLDFINDKKVVNILKMPVLFNFIKYEDDIFARNKKENINSIKEYINIEPELIVSSIKIVKVKYPNIYSNLGKIYDNIESLAKKNIEYITNGLIQNDIDRNVFRNNKNNSRNKNIPVNEINDKFEELDEKIGESVEKIKENISNGLEKGIEVIKKKSIYDMVNEVSPKLINKLENFIHKNKK